MISSIIKRATRKTGDRLQIGTWSTHERYDISLSKLNADFWLFPGEHVKPWNEKYSKIPANFHFVNDKLPDWITLDCIVSGNPSVHIPLGANLSKSLHIPLINIFHTCAIPGFTKEIKQNNQGFFDQCAHHVFITEFNKIEWQFSGDKNTSVIEHGIDSELFNPGDFKREPYILTVGNDFRNRDQELGFSLWAHITKGLPVKVVGSNPGISNPANSVEELVQEYQKSRIYLNTSLRSPLPMSLCEAASTGNAIVTSNMCGVSDFFTHGHDCLVFSPQNPERGRQYLEELLSNQQECKRLGENARETVLKRFGMDRFVREWTDLLEEVCEKPYLG